MNIDALSFLSARYDRMKFLIVFHRQFKIQIVQMPKYHLRTRFSLHFSGDGAILPFIIANNSALIIRLDMLRLGCVLEYALGMIANTNS